MSDSTPVRFGLLGAGLIAPFHANAIRRATGCELVAVADMNRERAEGSPLSSGASYARRLTHCWMMTAWM